MWSKPKCDTDTGMHQYNLYCDVMLAWFWCISYIQLCLIKGIIFLYQQKTQVVEFLAGCQCVFSGSIF